MSRPRQSHGRELNVAIIGGGASGTLTAAYLLRAAALRRLRLRVALIDQHGRHGLGVAYSTTREDHLLNVMAGQMSALPEDPGHLVRWANTARRDGLAAGPSVTETTFLSRPAYGRYLCDVLADAEVQAGPASRLSRITDEAVAILPGNDGPAARVALSRGHLDADVVVLATGNPPAALPLDVPPSSRIITDPWQPGGLSGPLGTGTSAVVVIGTGLTMLDVAVAITAANPDVVVHAVSRHGLLPRTHPGTRPAAGQPFWLPAIAKSNGPVPLTELLRQVRSAVGARPANWYDVMCALRPLVPDLWRRLTPADKQIFLDRLARYWEVHRHLVPPPTAGRVTALRLTGQLITHRGRVRVIASDADNVQVCVDSREETVQLNAEWLINSTGPGADVSASRSRLLRNLFQRGLARPDPLRLGVDASPDGAVLNTGGTPSRVLFALGPPLRGLWYETTAIPEIRAQADALARLITSDRRMEQRPPGSAA